MVADIGFDPGYCGLQTYEATDLLLRRRKICKDVHVVIWQVGCVGEIGYRRQGYNNDHFSVLVEHLQGIYGVDYIITHYIGAQYAFIKPVVEKFKLSELLLPGNQKKISGISTFYIPPAETFDMDFQLFDRIGRNNSKKIDNLPTFDPMAYSKPVNDIIASMRTFSIPKAYKIVHVGPFSDLLLRFAFDHKAMQQYEVDPELFHTKYPISSIEQAAISNQNPVCTSVLLKTSATDPSRQVAMRMLNDHDFAAKCQEFVTKLTDEWLAQQGYNGANIESVSALIPSDPTNQQQVAQCIITLFPPYVVVICLACPFEQ